MGCNWTYRRAIYQEQNNLRGMSSKIGSECKMDLRCPEPSTVCDGPRLTISERVGLFTGKGQHGPTQAVAASGHNFWTGRPMLNLPPPSARKSPKRDPHHEISRPSQHSPFAPVTISNFIAQPLLGSSSFHFRGKKTTRASITRQFGVPLFRHFRRASTPP